MDLRNFPMDTQKCLLNIEACKLTSEKTVPGVRCCDGEDMIFSVSEK